MSKVEWYEATFVGSRYQQQTSNTGKWRHRPLNPRRSLMNYTEAMDEDIGIGNWIDGPAPDMS